MYIPSVTHILPLTTIRRERLLSRPGEVLVATDDRVEASTTVAQAETVNRHYILDLARRLEAPAAEVEKYIKVEAGTIVDKGTVLALRPMMLGMGSLTVKAPAKGQMLIADSGKMLFASVGAGIELKAGFSGIVAGITPEYGAVIETVGALVQCWWGSGKQTYSVLRVMVTDPDQPLEAKTLDDTAKGTILVAGTADQHTLRVAETMKVRGLILGGLSASLVPVARAMSYPVVITESFGQKAMSEPVWRLLSGHDGREVTIDARFGDRWNGRRPELIIPLPALGNPPPLPIEAVPLEVGRQVRLLRPPFAGIIATVKALPERLQTLPSGVQTLCAQIEIEGQGEALVPVANLELFE